MTIFNCENSASARAESTSIGSEAQPDKTKGYTKCEVVQWRTHAVQSYPQGVKVNTAVPGSILAPRTLLLYRTPFTLFLHRAEQPSWLGGSLSLNSLFSFLGPSCLLTRVEAALVLTKTAEANIPGLNGGDRNQCRAFQQTGKWLARLDSCSSEKPSSPGFLLAWYGVL